MQQPRDLPRRAARILITLLSGGLGLGDSSSARGQAPARFEPIGPPAWARKVGRMAFVTPGQVDQAARSGVQVVHANAVWPYYPLRRDGGGLPEADARTLREFVARCHANGMRLVLGLPPFPPVSLVRDHPDWRVHPDDAGSVLKREPIEGDLGTRVGCNNGPWGDYLIDVCAELVEDYGLDGYSFDGNYHPPICYCPACKAAYRAAAGADLPPKADLDDLAYRRYLVWRGERLEGHYRRLQARLKGINPDAVLMSWTANAGRYGHLLHSPRAMPSRMNLLFDLPMQEWWLDETNQGASVAPAFGLAYLRGLGGGTRPVASEPYLMSRGNPYGTDSFPRHERIVRALQAIAHGNIPPESFGWPGHEASTADVFAAIAERERWTIGARPIRWAGLVVGESTRQFVSYKDVAGRYLPHLFGAFRAAMEEHRPLELINDWDLDSKGLGAYRVVVLAGTGALSEAQAEALRAYVRGGGGLVATCEAGLFDELGRPRPDFALADVFGVSYRGRPKEQGGRAQLDENFARGLDDAYWNDRVGVARLAWGDQDLMRDGRLAALVPGKSVAFKGPQVLVGEPADPAEVAARFEPSPGRLSTPAIVARRFGSGRVVYLAAGLDATLWNYAYPYQRALLVRALDWAASGPPPIAVAAPMAVQATHFEQEDATGRRVVIHLFNGLDSAAGHGRPGQDVPLREEAIPIHGIRVRFSSAAPARFHVEPGGIVPKSRREGEAVTVELPPLEVHAMLVGEYDPPEKE